MFNMFPDLNKIQHNYFCFIFLGSFVCVPPDQSMDIKWICVRTAHSVLALVADNPADTGAEDATDDKRLSPCTS